jgi:hypothetical protein
VTVRELMLRRRAAGPKDDDRSRRVTLPHPQSSAKEAHLERYGDAAIDPYLLALTVLAERFCIHIESDAERGRIVVERRTPQLDREVETAWT